MDANKWMSYECSDEGTSVRTFTTYLLVHMHKKRKIALEIAAKIASINSRASREVCALKSNFPDMKDLLSKR
jgi:hypothetical protein